MVNLWYCHTPIEIGKAKHQHVYSWRSSAGFFQHCTAFPKLLPNGTQRSNPGQIQTSTGVGQVFTECKHGGAVRKDWRFNHSRQQKVSRLWIFRTGPGQVQCLAGFSTSDTRQMTDFHLLLHTVYGLEERKKTTAGSRLRIQEQITCREVLG